MENELIESNTSTNDNIKGAFFPRIFSLLIDFLILAILGFILGLIFKPYFSLFGIHGVLIGWLISSIYFTIGYSKLLYGETVGKMIFAIKVTDINGKFLDVKSAAIRSLLFITPYYLLEYFQQLEFIPYFLKIMLSIIAMAYYIGLVYFLIVNTKSRQTIHDFFSKTIVIKHQQHFDFIPLAISKMKLLGYVGIVFILIISSSFFAFRVNDSNNFNELIEANQVVLIEIAAEVNEKDDILYVESSKINITIESQVGIVIEAWTRKDFSEFDYESLGSDIIDILAKKKFNISRIDYAEVILNYGYDIGIADSKKSKSWKIDN